MFRSLKFQVAATVAVSLTLGYFAATANYSVGQQADNDHAAAPAVQSGADLSTVPCEGSCCAVGGKASAITSTPATSGSKP